MKHTQALLGHNPDKASMSPRNNGGKLAHPTGFEPVASAFGGQREALSQRESALTSAGSATEQVVKPGVLLGHNSDKALKPPKLGAGA